ncbi:integrator complex subunit 1 [Ischnura elegans]|uniref:integrator complex subunit 1 n=1 Tax=Ischnura elegans TaxID=197161 RepID=UPI001ED87CFE|nr:integrator complex subunit 1 [Ischnura elegans]
MERGKSSVGRGGKGKTQQHPSDIFALGSKSTRPESTETKRPGVLHNRAGNTHPAQGGERKRDGTSSAVVASALVPKKTKITHKTTPPPGEAWEMVALSDWDSGTGGAELAPLVLEAADADEADRVVGLLCGAIRHLRASQRSKATVAAVSSTSAGGGISPNPQQDLLLYVSLLYIGKVRPSLFAVDVVCHALCSLLRKDPHSGGSSAVGGGVTPGLPPFKIKNNPSVPILAANLLLRGFQEKKTWPETFLKLYVEDSIGDRIWVDAEECRPFVENILTAIDTKATPLHSRPLLGPGMAPPDPVTLALPIGRTEGCSSPSIIGPDEDMSLSVDGGGEMSSVASGMSVGEGAKEKADIAVIPRYANSSESVEQIVMDAVREQLNRRQPPENITRNFLRLLTSSAGLVEVRLTAASRLEMWLQNPKLTRPAQELLLSVCTNCSSHTQRDVEVISHLVKIRLKTKALINLYLGGIRELIGANPDNLMTVLKHTIYNELSTARNPNNMAMIAVIFQASPEQAATLLAEIFQDLLMNREDYHRPLRALLREVVRVLRHDVDLGALARGLMRERTPPPALATASGEIEHRERMFVAVVDLVALCVFLAVSPNVREAANLIARGDRREIKVIQAFQMQVAKIQRDAVWWLHETVPKMYRPGSSEFVHALHKVLFMEQPEQYYKWDSWPVESDRPLMQRLAAEVPVLQNTLIRIFVIGLSKEHPLSAPDTLELGDQLVKRAAALAAANDMSPCTNLPHPPYTMLYADKLEIIDLIFNLSAYHHPENINLPAGYCPPQLAISNLYWKAWVMLLIISAHNPTTFGSIAWEKYPTLRTFMEMCITNHFNYPPPTIGGNETIEDVRTKELQTSSLEKQRILEFESHLAAASTKMAITEQTSLLLSQLITMDPTGTPRKPPLPVLEQLRTLNTTLRMGHLLCRSRRPDFLLDVIQRQGTSQSMPWLADLVESSDGAFSHLPVQCLCEFLLSDAMAGTEEGTAATMAEGVDVSQGSSRAREKHHKQLRLLRHLQALLQGSGGEEGIEISEGEAQDSQAACEVLEYFLRRLSSQQASSRAQAIKGLKLVLNPVGHEDEEPMEVEGEAPNVTALAAQRIPTSSVGHLDDISPSGKGIVGAASRVALHDWLLCRLPQLLHFPRVRPGVVNALRQACQVENDPSLVDAYIQFLAMNAAHDDLNEMSDVVVDMAQLIVERSTIIGAILPPVGEESHFSQTPGGEADPGSEAPGSAALHALSVIFHSYLEKVRRDAALRRGNGGGTGTNGSEACYPWSESMDQILVTWSTGEECTLHILVVQAIIILLTYGPGHDVELFNSLLDAWFPLPPNEPPRAFLVDTSEEALLAPDWLKLRMIRSPVERLVDAALQDLDPSQLVLFIQSFGIPIASMSKLLHTLDTAVETDRFAVGEAVLDKTYMAQLVQVQRHRGATGGYKFVQVLRLQEPKLPEVTHIVCSTMRKKLPSIASVPPVHMMQHQGAGSLLKPEDVPTLLSQLYSPLASDAECGHAAFRILQKALAAERQIGKGEPLKAIVIFNLDKILSQSEQYGDLARCIMAVPQYSCPLFRLLLLPLDEATSSRELIDAQYRICSTILHVSISCRIDSPVKGILQNFIRIRKKSNPGTVIKKLRRQLNPEDLQSIPLLQLERHGKWILEEGLQRRHTSELVEAMASLLLDQDEKAPVACREKGMRKGLFLDWLATFEPEMIGSCPKLQMKLLFSKSDPEFPTSALIKHESLEESSMESNVERGKLIKKGTRSFRPYLLTLLAHQAGWGTLHQCVSCFLEKCDTSYDPGAVLDFLWALMSNPKLWQGREKLTPKHYTLEDILGLTKSQLFVLVEYIVEEAANVGSKGSTRSSKPEDGGNQTGDTLFSQLGEEEESIEVVTCRRMPLLLQCACEDPAKLGAVASHLASLAVAVEIKTMSSEAISDHQKDVARAAQILLVQLYLHMPSVLKRVGGIWCGIGDENVISGNRDCGLIDGTRISDWSSSILDGVSHTLLTALGATNSAKDWSRRAQEYELSARKMASVHPLLVLRQLPMLGSSLQGRVHFDWGVFRSRNHLTLFQQVLGLLELLQPRIFASEYSSGLEYTLDAFFALFAHHGLMKDVVTLLVRVVTLIQGFISYDAQRALKYLQKHANVLNDLQLNHPNLPSLRALLSGISLPKMDGGEGGRGGEMLLTAIAPMQSTVEPSLPHWSQAQLAPLLSKLEKTNGEDVLAALQELEHASLRRPSILDPFMESVCQLVLNLSSSIRTLALTLLLRHLRHSPPKSASPSPVLASFVRCLDHSNPPDVLLSALDRLPEVVVCAQEHAVILLQKAFNLGMYSYINTAPHISKAIAMLNVQSGY